MWEETVTPARSRAKQAHDVIRKHIRTLTAQDFASSYNQICHCDFSDLPDGSSLANLGLTASNAQIFQHNARVDETLAAMENDERVLATNLVCLGEILDQFVVSLFQNFEFAPFFEKDKWLWNIKKC